MHKISLRVEIKQGGFKFPIHYLYNKLIFSIENSNKSMQSKFGLLAVMVFSLLFICSVQQSCTPNYLLTNIIQDQVIFQPTSVTSSFNSTYSYPFPRTFFTTTPSILSTFDNFQISSFSQLNYNLSSSVSGMFVNFAFSSSSMTWTILRVKFWLMARTDIMYGKFTLQNFQSNKNQTFKIPILPSFSSFVDGNIIQLNFITGLRATSASNTYYIDVSNNGATNSSFDVTVAPLGDTSISVIQVSYAIFNLKSSYFASGGGQINNLNYIGSSYKKVHGSFAPIIYILYGFNSIKISKLTSLNIQFYFDSDYVMETYTGQNFDILGVTYLTIGQHPNQVCQNCTNKWISSTSCSASCPSNTYPVNQCGDGVKSCLTCSAKLNQTLDEFNTKCICFDGLTRIDGVCIPSTTPIKCGSNQILSSGKCVCIDGYQTVNGTCSTLCDSNSLYNATTQSCQCKFGFFLIQDKCGLCPSDRTYNSTFKACICGNFQVPNSVSGKCQCSSGYFNFSNSCVTACPSNTILSNGSCIVIIVNNCSVNESGALNGSCVCVANTYRVNGICTVCQIATYYNQSSQACLPCPTNCKICSTLNTCSQCYPQYTFEAVQKICKLDLYDLLKNNPEFTMGGVITNFGTNRTVPVQTPDQIASMVNIKFPNSDIEPSQIFYSQNPTNSSQFKVFFSYCNSLIPLSTYNATYTFTDPTLGSQKITVNYNAVQKGLTHTLK